MRMRRKPQGQVTFQCAAAFPGQSSFGPSHTGSGVGRSDVRWSELYLQIYKYHALSL